MTFEANIRRLEEIVDGLDNESVELDQALKLFEEGIGLLRNAASALGTAESRVKQLVEEADGVIAAKDFDA